MHDNQHILQSIQRLYIKSSTYISAIMKLIISVCYALTSQQSQSIHKPKMTTVYLIWRTGMKELSWRFDALKNNLIVILNFLTLFLDSEVGNYFQMCMFGIKFVQIDLQLPKTHNIWCIGTSYIASFIHWQAGDFEFYHTFFTYVHILGNVMHDSDFNGVHNRCDDYVHSFSHGLIRLQPISWNFTLHTIRSSKLLCAFKRMLIRGI